MKKLENLSDSELEAVNGGESKTVEVVETVYETINDVYDWIIGE